MNVDGFGASNDGRWRVTGRERLGVGGNLKARLLRADVSVAFLDRPVAFGARWTRLRAHAYAGARFYDVRLDVPRVLGFVTGLDASDEWVDPILGLRVAWALSRRFTLRAESDLGGFGLGSDVAWWISATLEVRVTKVVSVGLGFNHLRFTRDLREVGRRLDWDLELSGPTLSIGFRF